MGCDEHPPAEFFEGIKRTILHWPNDFIDGPIVDGDDAE